MKWFEASNIDQIDSPALLIYPDRIQHNIKTMIANVGNNPKRLFPHVKTHKMAEVVKMQLTKGIERFKCATISELEMTLEDLEVIVDDDGLPVSIDLNGSSSGSLSLPCYRLCLP